MGRSVFVFDTSWQIFWRFEVFFFFFEKVSVEKMDFKVKWEVCVGNGVKHRLERLRSEPGMVRGSPRVSHPHPGDHGPGRTTAQFVSCCLYNSLLSTGSGRQLWKAPDVNPVTRGHWQAELSADPIHQLWVHPQRPNLPARVRGLIP